MYIKKIEDIPNEALEILKKNFGDKTNYDGEYTDFEDMNSICELVREAYDDSSESVSSDYITKTYVLEVDGWRFEVDGNSYRKDQCICDEKLDNGILVINIAEEKNKKLLEKNSKKSESDKKWLNLLESLKSSNIETVYNILKNYKFPKEW
jgi:hypothetical protein